VRGTFGGNNTGTDHINALVSITYGYRSVEVRSTNFLNNLAVSGSGFGSNPGPLGSSRALPIQASSPELPARQLVLGKRLAPEGSTLTLLCANSVIQIRIWAIHPSGSRNRILPGCPRSRDLNVFRDGVRSLTSKRPMALVVRSIPMQGMPNAGECVSRFFLSAWKIRLHCPEISFGR